MSAHAARRPRDLPLTLSAVAGVAVVLAVVVLGLTHTRPVVFRSGSMSPTIPTGSVALVHRVPASDLAIGDVVTLTSSADGSADGSGTAVTHRIVQLTRGAGVATLQTRGDANAAPDPDLHRVGSAERVVVAVPRLGYVLTGVTGPAGWFLAGVYTLWLLRRVGSGPRPTTGRHRAESPAQTGRRTGGQRRRSRWPRTRWPRIHGPSFPWPSYRRAAVGAAAVTLAVGGGLVTLAPRASADWADTAPVDGTTIAARTVPAPATFACGAVGLLTVSFTWSSVAGATGYDLHYGSGGSQVMTVTGTSHTFLTALASGTAWVQANVDYGSSTWTSLPSTSRSYSVAVVSFCG